ncbi:BRO-N domain-containing protein [Laribacter hongkongensis]|uniref:Bro-N domain-containing protein n=1 Tax=Laribacter hongkongensis TaxID=168471 RepID=A0ABD4SUF2_9NEIS|nr:Bro-N domain-containing protein [Laribacter hongkongensis]MCG9026847.1 Bro-N domain-containing protein [Laribacter hongkongensis]
MHDTAKGAFAPATFSFESHAVRTINRDGEIWFILNDVTEALAFTRGRNAARMLDDDERGAHIVSTLGGKQELTIINESGLYSLILRSRKPEAKRFKKWVTSEVLPTIRKTGTYSTTPRRSKASREAAVWLSETEAFNLAGLLGMLPYFKAVQQKAEKVLRAAESPLAPSMFDAWHETEFFCGILKPVRDRCKPVQARLSAPILRQNHL